MLLTGWPRKFRSSSTKLWASGLRNKSWRSLIAVLGGGWIGLDVIRVRSHCVYGSMGDYGVGMDDVVLNGRVIPIVIFCRSETHRASKLGRSSCQCQLHTASPWPPSSSSLLPAIPSLALLLNYPTQPVSAVPSSHITSSWRWSR